MSMMPTEEAVNTFLTHRRIAVVGVSRKGESPANAIAKRLRETGHEVFAVNPNAETVDEHPCFPTVDAIAGGVGAVVSVTRKDLSAEVAEQAARAGASWIWFHQGFGPVSFDERGVQTARERGLNVIAVGCPMMYVTPDGAHACFKHIFGWFGRIPKQLEVLDDDVAAPAAADA